MPKITGLNAKLYHYDGTLTRTMIGEGSEITLSIEAEEIETTSFDSGGWREVMPGIKSWSVDEELFFVAADAGQTELYDALVAGELVTVEFYPADGATAAGYQGQAMISSWEIGAPLDGAVTVSVSLTGSGALAEFTKP